MKFNDAFVSRDLRFSLGEEEESGRYYLSIPVANRMVDYEEYYEIDRATYERYRAEPEAAIPFLERCRKQEVDELLILKPGTDRGVAS